MPMSGTSGASFIGWQSQCGETSQTNEIWKHGLPRQTAVVYSAIFPCIMRQGSPKSEAIASRPQAPMHRPHPTQSAGSIRAFRLSTVHAPCAHSFAHLPQPTQRFWSTEGCTEECMAFFPARDPQPMPIFLSVPPIPVIS